MTLGGSKLGFDGPFERFLGQVAAERVSVDEEPRGAREPGPQPQLPVLLDLYLILAAGQAGIELFLIDL